MTRGLLILLLGLMMCVAWKNKERENYSPKSGVTWHEGVQEVKMKDGADWILIDLEKNMPTSSDRLGTYGPDGKITWYGGERPGKTKWVKNEPPKKRKKFLKII